MKVGSYLICIDAEGGKASEYLQLHKLYKVNDLSSFFNLVDLENVERLWARNRFFEITDEDFINSNLFKLLFN